MKDSPWPLCSKGRPCYAVKIINGRDGEIARGMQREKSMICCGGGRDATWQHTQGSNSFDMLAVINKT